MSVFETMKNTSPSTWVFIAILPLLLSACSSTPEEDTSIQTTQPAEQSQHRQTCPDIRPQICTMIYQPVCAVKQDGSLFTAASDCSACATADVVAYSDGECATDSQDK
ncbi:MAG: hypothetical protein KAG18_07795 [Sinobacterium sp.]|nr:hypothetical protein [Sinobacterium sp.]